MWKHEEVIKNAAVGFAPRQENKKEINLGGAMVHGMCECDPHITWCWACIKK